MLYNQNQILLLYINQIQGPIIFVRMNIFVQEPNLVRKNLLSELMDKISIYFNGLGQQSKLRRTHGLMRMILYPFSSKHQDLGKIIIDLTKANQVAQSSTEINIFNRSLQKIAQFVANGEKIYQGRQKQQFISNKNNQERMRLLKKRYHKIIENQQRKNYSNKQDKVKNKNTMINLHTYIQSRRDIEKSLLQLNRNQSNLHTFSKLKLEQHKIVEKLDKYETEQQKTIKRNIFEKINQSSNKSQPSNIQVVSQICQKKDQKEQEKIQKSEKTISSNQNNLNKQQQSSEKQLNKITIKQNPFLNKQAKKLNLDAIISLNMNINRQIQTNYFSNNNHSPINLYHNTQNSNISHQNTNYPLLNNHELYNEANYALKNQNRLNTQCFSTKTNPSYSVILNPPTNYNMITQNSINFSNQFASSDQTKKAVQNFFGEPKINTNYGLFEENNRTERKSKPTNRKSRGPARVS